MGTKLVDQLVKACKAAICCLLIQPDDPELEEKRYQVKEMLKAAIKAAENAPDLLKALKIMTSLCRLKYGNLDKAVWAEIHKAETAIAAAEK